MSIVLRKWFFVIAKHKVEVVAVVVIIQAALKRDKSIPVILLITMARKRPSDAKRGILWMLLATTYRKRRRTNRNILSEWWLWICGLYR